MRLDPYGIIGGYIVGILRVSIYIVTIVSLDYSTKKLAPFHHKFLDSLKELVSDKINLMNKLQVEPILSSLF